VAIGPPVSHAPEAVQGAQIAASGATNLAPDAVPPDAASLWWLPVTIGMHLVGSLLLGCVVAAVLWALGRFLSMRIELFMVLVCFGIAVVSAELAADPLLVALTAGILLANIGASRAMPRLLASMDGLLLPVYCVFFAVAGAKVHLDAVAMVWPAMAAVVVVRLVAKRLAVTRAARRAGVPEPIAGWLWTSTLPQAGVTLAMAIQFERSFEGHPWTPVVSALLLSTVACNELIGPPLMKLGIQRTAEAGP
jgi:Kef-type K+ transport system membrane component KefB